MTFADFVGHGRVVRVLRRMLTSGRVPHALLFAGQRGVGKFTLATLFARAANCEQHPDDACGSCRNCRTLAALDDLATLESAARDARGNAPPDVVPLLLRPHPSVTVLVPDGPFIRVSQMRHVVRQAYTVPVDARRNVFIFDQAERLRFDYADVLLKVLEEPPERTTIILVTDAPYELRATIRSRCIPLFFAPLSTAEISGYLQQHRPSWKKADRELAAAVAAGSLGTALSLDLESYREVRQQALELLRAAAREKVSPERLFAATAALARKDALAETEPGEGRQAFEFSLDILYSLLTDILYSKVDAANLGLRHPDLRSELRRLASQISWWWLNKAVGHLDRLQGWRRRNINRQLALDAWALELARPS